MKTFVKTSLFLVAFSILSEIALTEFVPNTVLAGCPGGVCPTGRGRAYSRSYSVYGGRRAFYGASSDCGGVSSYGAVNHRERTYVGAFGRTHHRVHHHHHTVTP